MTPRLACPMCYGDGVVTVGGTSLNPSSGVRVSDPQQANDVRCPGCGGDGWADEDRLLDYYTAKYPAREER